MKIAIAAEGKEADSTVSSKGGRSPYYIIFEDGKILESIKNPFARGSGGAGFSVAYMLAEKGVEKVVAGKIGENMVAALREKNIIFIEASESDICEIVVNKILKN